MTSEFAASILRGDRRALARAITLIESTRQDHAEQGEALLNELLPATGRAIRIGITGSPGVGKSTFIDAFGSLILDSGSDAGSSKIAVLAVDPSSISGGGSILGDKTRMASLTHRPEAFIRPSPSSGNIGGIGRRTRDAILLCEAAGFQTILVETVGVGQSETAVATVTDLFLLLVSPGGGDDLQGIKRGVMELADLVVVNKADGPTADLAAATAADYQLALHLVRPKRQDAHTEVMTCSSVTGENLKEVWTTLSTLHRSLSESGELQRLRRQQSVSQLDDEIRLSLFARASDNQRFAEERSRLEQAVANGELPVSAATRILVDTLWQNPGKASGHA